MTLPEKIMRDIDMLNEKDRQKDLKQIIEKYIAPDTISLNENYSWWDHEEDDVYNDE